MSTSRSDSFQAIYSAAKACSQWHVIWQMHLCYNDTSAAATIFQATHMMAKPKQKSVRELVEAFLKTQHEENRYVSQPSLTLQANEIKG